MGKFSTRLIPTRAVPQLPDWWSRKLNCAPLVSVSPFWQLGHVEKELDLFAEPRGVSPNTEVGALISDLVGFPPTEPQAPIFGVGGI